MFVQEKMKTTTHILFSVLFIFFLTSLSGCLKKKESTESMTLSQLDIDKLVQHKKQVDQITKKYDNILKKTTVQKRSEVLAAGKNEIDKYLRSKKLDPVFFMRKSKKILKGYIAFYSSSEAALEKRLMILRKQNLSKKEIEANIAAFKKVNDRTFKEMTSELTDYEVELIRSNFKKLSSVTNL